METFDNIDGIDIAYEEIVSMIMFWVLQGGFICSSLFAGLVSLYHMTANEKWRCKNTFALGVLILAGIFHVAKCVALVNEQEMGYTLRTLEPAWYCIDFFGPAAYANALVFFTIGFLLINRMNELKNNSGSEWNDSVTVLKKVILFTCILIGVVCAINGSNIRTFEQGEELILTVGGQEYLHVSAYTTVCKGEVAREWYRLLYEYLLIYLPVLVVVGGALYDTFTMTTKEISLWDLKILTNDNCRSSDKEDCTCTRLNHSLISILVYAAVFLLLARPAQLLYAHATSGYFRDVIPCLLQTITYCSLCFDYICKIVLPFYANRSQEITQN